MIALVIALGLVCWIATTIVVESEVFRPIRDFLQGQADVWADVVRVGEEDPELRFRRDVPLEVLYRKAGYLAHCHLCAGTWIALVLVALVPVGVFGGGFLGWLLSGLLVKAVGHLILVAVKAGEAVAR